MHFGGRSVKRGRQNFKKWRGDQDFLKKMVGGTYLGRQYWMYDAFTEYGVKRPWKSKLRVVRAGIIRKGWEWFKELCERVSVADVRWECTEGRLKCEILFEDWLVGFQIIYSIGLTGDAECRHRVYWFWEGPTKV